MVAGISFITYLLIVFGAITSIEALKWDGVQSTSLSSSPGWNPLPTSKPQIGTAAVLLGSNNLRRGQAMGAICGYINGLTDNPFTCHGVTSTICSPISSLGVLGCCDKWDSGSCFSHTDCINSYENLIICSGSRGCPLNDRVRTCTSPDSPFCQRYTYSGYSIFDCGIYPTVELLSMTFFSSGAGTNEGTTTGVAASETARAHTTATSCKNSNCPVMVSSATIASSIVGGLLILATGAVGVIYLLRHSRLNVTERTMRHNRSSTSPGSTNQSSGHFPAVQYQQPTAAELP